MSVESNLGLLWFRFILLCDWSRNSRHSLNQSDSKLKLVATWSLACRPRLRRFACFHFEFSSAPCDFFLAMIGCCGCFGFGFTTLNRKAFYESLFNFSMKTLSVLDSTLEAVYPKIVSIVDEELFSLQVCKTRNVYFRLGTE